MEGFEDGGDIGAWVGEDVRQASAVWSHCRRAKQACHLLCERRLAKQSNTHYITANSVFKTHTSVCVCVCVCVRHCHACNYI